MLKYRWMSNNQNPPALLRIRTTMWSVQWSRPWQQCSGGPSRSTPTRSTKLWACPPWRALASPGTPRSSFRKSRASPKWPIPGGARTWWRPSRTTSITQLWRFASGTDGQQHDFQSNQSSVLNRAVTNLALIYIWSFYWSFQLNTLKKILNLNIAKHWIKWVAPFFLKELSFININCQFRAGIQPVSLSVLIDWLHLTSNR